MRAALTVDALHIISDLHMGGKKGFQIFRAADEFAVLVRALTAESAEKKIGLVVNGDFVDFLAEQPAVYFDVVHAEDKLRRILNDPAFAPVTVGLQTLLAMPNVSVAIALGNHDVELALPWVTDALSDILSCGNGDARRRLTLETAGTDISARVGRAKVLCIHGNEFDEWNVTDYEALRRSMRALRWGATDQPYEANAGTRLVVDVMNSIKERYPFVDLLKPETGAVLPLLLALDPSLIRRVPDAARTFPRLVRDTLRLSTGLLGDADANGTSEKQTARRPVSPRASVVRRERDEFAAMLLNRAEGHMREGVEPRTLASTMAGEDLLGMSAALWKLSKGAPRAEVLREAIDYLDSDRSFDLGEMDATFLSADIDVPSDVDVVVTGHTHLERVIRRRNGTGWYFNSGTWASLMRIEPSVRRDPNAFEEFFGGLGGHDLDRLEADGLLRRRPAVVSVWSDGARVRAGLRHVKSDKEPFAVVEGGEVEVN